MKWLKGILYVIGALIIISACSEEEATTEETTEVVEEAPEATTEPKSIENEPIEEEPQVDTGLLEYGTLMSDLMGRFSIVMGDFSALMTKAGTDPNLMFDDSWKTDVAVQITEMQVTIDDIRAIEPPQEAQEAHAIVLEAMDHYEYANDNIGSAIDNVDIDLMNECGDRLSLGTLKIQEATTLIDELTNSY